MRRRGDMYTTTLLGICFMFVRGDVFYVLKLVYCLLEGLIRKNIELVANSQKFE